MRCVKEAATRNQRSSKFRTGQRTCVPHPEQRFRRGTVEVPTVFRQSLRPSSTCPSSACTGTLSGRQQLTQERDNRTQEQESVAGVVIVIVRRSVITTGPHGGASESLKINLARLRADTIAHRGNNPDQEEEQQQHRRGPGRAREEAHPGPRRGEGRERPTRANLPVAPFPDLLGDAGKQPLEHDLSGDEVAFARDERAQNGQRVSVKSPTGAPDDRGVGNVLTEERGEVRAIVVKFGHEHGLGAVWIGLLGVRRADRDVEGSVRVAEGGPEICAREEARDLSLGGAVGGLGSSVNKCSDRVVTASGLAQGTTSGVGSARVQGANLAGGAGR